MSTTNYRSNLDDEVVNVQGYRGILMNRRDEENFRGPIPLREYPINQDPNPIVLRKPLENALINAKQDVTVRFLEPPTPPPPGEIVIKYEKPIVPPKGPPVVIRTQPQAKAMSSEPIVIREAPPRMPQPLPPRIIKVLPPLIPPPPRKLIVEKFPPVEDRQRAVVIERWLAPKQQPRRVIVDGFVNVEQYKAEPIRNEIIEYEAPKINVTQEIRDKTVVRMDPNQYVSMYRDSLIDPKDLPAFAKEVRPPQGYALASESGALNQPPPLEGDVDALAKLDLDKEGLSEYKIFVQRYQTGGGANKYGGGSTTTTTTNINTIPTSPTSSSNLNGNTISNLVIDGTRVTIPATNNTTTNNNNNGGYYASSYSYYRSDNTSL